LSPANVFVLPGAADLCAELFVVGLPDWVVVLITGLIIRLLFPYASRATKLIDPCKGDTATLFNIKVICNTF